MVDKKYCMSSYLAFRFIEDSSKDFFEGTRHNMMPSFDSNNKRIVASAAEIDEAIKDVFSSLKEQQLGILLSGGMDSAILASYMRGRDAYTFRFENGTYQSEELRRAEYYAQRWGLNLHYVDINWNDTVERHLDGILQAKGAPVHSIEPQILQAALQAKQDGISMMVIGESSDLIFGGMDQLLSRDWTVEEFMQRYIFTQPSDVLVDPEDMSYLFERFRCQGNEIDFLQFMDHVFSVESSNSYFNALQTAGMEYIDPYANLKMDKPLDLFRIRSGEPKYLIRELFSMKYPDIPIPDKIPMPRPVDFYFKDWTGPVRHEFKRNLDMRNFTGNQKWQLYCLEHFLDLYEPEKR